MIPPHIRIFPHSKKEFSSVDMLTTWLLTGLKARGGQYLLVSKSAVAELPPGSLVLFRYDEVVVGEAVVKEYLRDSPVRDRTLAGEVQEYEASVWCLPSSIRVYAPPVEIEALQSFVGESPNMIPSAQPKFKIDWNVYPKLLAHIVGKSGLSFEKIH
jgi:hypothetical protein